MITNKKYQEFKNSINKSYSEKFSVIRISSIIFSFFGNLTSIFFAFFFFLSLFTSILFNINMLWIGVGVVVFLVLFEYIKRYVFDLFSIELLKNEKFNKNKIMFLIMTLVMVSFSFLFSLNGAQRLVNNETFINETISYNINSKTDSINNYYLINYIKPYQDENSNLISQQAELTNQQTQLVNKGWNTTSISEQLKSINEQIFTNKTKISKYEDERNFKIKNIINNENNILSKEKNKNNTNIFYFLFLSTIIELIIIIGVFYNRYYEHRTIKEYEEETVNTLAYKNWIMYSDVLNIIFSKEIKKNEYIPSANSILETIDANDLNISKSDLTKCFKTFNYLGISETKGPKRLLRMSKTKSEELLKNYFKIK